MAAIIISVARVGAGAAAVLSGGGGGSHLWLLFSDSIFDGPWQVHTRGRTKTRSCLVLFGFNQDFNKTNILYKILEMILFDLLVLALFNNFPFFFAVINF